MGSSNCRCLKLPFYYTRTFSTASFHPLYFWFLSCGFMEEMNRLRFFTSKMLSIYNLGLISHTSHSAQNL